jgi:UDP-N-acetylglucosamine--N-acetylmuramyl-(pentapeptide) pyrophosphoryl-undecaprenol N-acetylglucosamine transferase
LRVLIFGGSGGAHTLNEAMVGAATLWRQQPALAIWMQTGPKESQLVEAAYRDFPSGRARIDPYLFDMPSALSWADLAVCRAGAMTLAELAAMAKPAILVPFPHATDDHQLLNARECEAAGAAVVLTDEDCTGDSLAALVQSLAADRSRLQAMSQAAGARSQPDAAQRIAADLIAQAGGILPAAEAEEAQHVP